jgi:hypothetical protein
MPKPKPNETEEHFISRCIPQIIDEGKPADQAAAICHSIWENKSKELYMADNVIRKVFESSVKSFDDNELTIEHFISTEQIDRTGDLMRADGMVLPGRPVVLKQHGKDPQTGYEPIAKPLSIKVATNDKGVKGILVKTKYYDGSTLIPPDNTGRRLYEKARDGYMPYWSIGFIKPKGNRIEGKGMEYTYWECVEYSQVGVPDNIGAEVVKSMSSDELIKQANELLEFGVEKEPEPQKQQKILGGICVSGADEELIQLLKDYTKEELVERLTIKRTNFKSIAERVSRDLPWEAMRILWFGMLDELAGCDGSKKAVKIIMEEMNELLMPHALAFAMAFNNNNQEIQVVKSQIKEGYYNRPTAEAVAPVEKPVVPETKTPADNPIHKAILGLVDAPPKSCVRMSFKKEDIQQLVSEAVKTELQTAIKKMKGKV